METLMQLSGLTHTQRITPSQLNGRNRAFVRKITFGLPSKDWNVRTTLASISS